MPAATSQAPERSGLTTIEEAARRLVAASCEAQGVELTITDPVVLGKVAAMLKGGERPATASTSTEKAASS